MTDTARIKLTIEYDADAKVWFVSNSSVPGLCLEAESLLILGVMLDQVIPELAKENKDEVACAALGIDLEGE